MFLGSKFISDVKWFERSTIIWQSIGDSCSVLLWYLHPSKYIYDRYLNKDKLNTLSGINIIRKYVLRVTKREKLCIRMENEEFDDHEFHCVQRWFRVKREISNAHLFGDSEEKEEGGGGYSLIWFLWD